MNQIFEKKKTNVIILDDNYFLSPDQFKGLVLTKEETKTRKKLNEDRKPTGETESYTDKKEWFYPKLSQTLNKYLELKTCEAKSVEELKEIVLRIETTISKL